jgi:hypothetical protein
MEGKSPMVVLHHSEESISKHDLSTTHSKYYNKIDATIAGKKTIGFSVPIFLPIESSTSVIKCGAIKRDNKAILIPIIEPNIIRYNGDSLLEYVIFQFVVSGILGKFVSSNILESRRIDVHIFVLKYLKHFRRVNNAKELWELDILQR